MVKFQFKLNSTSYKWMFIILSIVIFIIMTSISFDYGISNDEPMHDVHGKLILKYFQGKDSIASMSPIDNDGGLIKTFSPVVDDKIQGMNFFGGFFDFVVALGNQIFPSVGEYELRHLINSIFGFLIILFVGLLAKNMDGWKTGLLALVFAVLTPRLFGHSFNNSKDIPFAAFYIISIYSIFVFLKNLPKFKIANIIFVILSISISIAIRVSGLLLIAYLFLFTFIYWFIDAYKNKFEKEKINSGFKIAGVVILIGLASYFATAIFWPFMRTNIFAPILVLQKVSNFNIFNSYELYSGKWINAWEIPWHYTIKWILITIPLFVFTGLFLIVLLFFQKKLKVKSVELKLLSFLIFTFVFPVFYIIIKDSNIYNGIRHLLFVFPPLIVCCAFAWKFLIKLVKPTMFYYATTAILIIFLFQPLKWMIKNHPFQSMYFSPVVGGIDGAFKKYEMDYWGVSNKAAVEWINENIEAESENNPIRVKMFYGERLKTSYYTEKYPKLEYAYGNSSDNWDYEIVFPAAAKFNQDLLWNWPPKETVHEIKAGNTPLCAIVKNQFETNLLSLEEKVKLYPTSDNFIELSLFYYGMNDFNKCIVACREALKIDSKNAIAYNNICSAYNSMQMFEDAEKACNNALKYYPEFELAKNNLNVAQDGIKSFKKINLGVQEYLTLSYDYYMQGDYYKSIEITKKIIEIEPDNFIAYNNMCSAYNALGKYKLAKKACEKAMKINPENQLAKNNLKVANDGLTKTK